MKLFIGSIVGRTEEVGFSQSMRLLWRELDRTGIEFTDGTVVGDALVSRSRSMVASTFMRSDCDVMLSIDSDIWFRAVDAIKLAEAALEYDMIGALYMTRNLNTQPALMLPMSEGISFDSDAQPVQTPFVAGGFTAVNRRVFEALSAGLPLCHQGCSSRSADTSFWPFYMPFVIPSETEGSIYLSEDWALCERARDAGFQVWLDPSIRLGHMGSYMYTLEDLIRGDKPAAQPLKLLRESDGTLSTFQAEASISQGGER